jgi:hypothetical protein
MKNERLYKNTKLSNPIGIDLKSSYIPIDNNAWGRSKVLSLQELSDLLSKNYGRGIGNVINVTPDVSSAPHGLDLIQSYIAIDENYLYVWVKGRWKKVPMMEL